MNPQDWLKQALDRIEERQQKTDDKTSEIKLLLVPLIERVSHLEAELKPVREHVAFMRTTGKLIGWSGTCLGLAAGIWRAFR